VMVLDSGCSFRALRGLRRGVGHGADSTLITVLSGTIRDAMSGRRELEACYGPMSEGGE